MARQFIPPLVTVGPLTEAEADKVRRQIYDAAGRPIFLPVFETFARPYDEEPEPAEPIFSDLVLVYLAVALAIALLLGAG